VPNIEKVRASRRAFYWRHKERIIAGNKEYRAAYYLKNRDKIRKKAKKYYLKNKRKILAKAKKSRPHTSAYWKEYRKRAYVKEFYRLYELRKTWGKFAEARASLLDLESTLGNRKPRRTK
jgi:hypothetical protein